MARSRNIKPGFFQNDELSELSPLTRLAFIGMWTIADFKGCIEFRPKMLKVQLLPYDDCDMESISDNLEKARFIRYYVVQGKRYIKIVNFEKHQNPHKNEREAGSEIPDITEKETIDNKINELTQDGTKPDLFGTTRADSLNLIPSTLIPDSITKKKPYAEYSAEFELAWSKYPRTEGVSKKDSFKAWSARIKSGVSAEVMTSGVERYADYCKTLGTEQRFIKQPETFFGTSEHYLIDWDASKVTPKRGITTPENFTSKNYGTGVNDL